VEEEEEKGDIIRREVVVGGMWRGEMEKDWIGWRSVRRNDIKIDAM